MLVDLAGADGIVVHLREDRRHIHDKDLLLLREIVRTKLDLEMAADEAMAKIALNVKPDLVTLVPEKRQELTTEGGLDVAGQRDRLRASSRSYTMAAFRSSVFVEPDLNQIKAAHKIAADWNSIPVGTPTQHAPKKPTQSSKPLPRPLNCPTSSASESTPVMD